MKQLGEAEATALSLSRTVAQAVAGREAAVATSDSTSIALLALSPTLLTSVAAMGAMAAMVTARAQVDGVDVAATAATPISIAPILAYGPALVVPVLHLAQPRQSPAEYPAPLAEPGKL